MPNALPSSTNLTNSINWTAAYVLHRRAYKENSQIVKLFTLQFGVLDGVYRHKKNPIDYFCPYMVEIKGRSELKTITKCESVANAVPLLGNAVFAGMYINELLSYCLNAGEPMPHSFALYGLVLQSLACAKQDSTRVAGYLRIFEMTLLYELGHLASFSHDANGDAIKLAAYYIYRPNQGFSERLGQTSAMVVQLLGADIVNINQLYLATISAWQAQPSELGLTEVGSVDALLVANAALLKRLKLLLAPIINELLAGRPLRSRELWRQVAIKS